MEVSPELFESVQYGACRVNAVCVMVVLPVHVGCRYNRMVDGGRGARHRCRIAQALLLQVVVVVDSVAM